MDQAEEQSARPTCVRAWMHDTDFLHEPARSPTPTGRKSARHLEQENVELKTAGIDIGSSTLASPVRQVVLQRQTRPLEPLHGHAIARSCGARPSCSRPSGATAPSMPIASGTSSPTPIAMPARAPRHRFRRGHSHREAIKRKNAAPSTSCSRRGGKIRVRRGRPPPRGRLAAHGSGAVRCPRSANNACCTSMSAAAPPSCAHRQWRDRGESAFAVGGRCWRPMIGSLDPCRRVAAWWPGVSASRPMPDAGR